MVVAESHALPLGAINPKHLRGSAWIAAASSGGSSPIWPRGLERRHPKDDVRTAGRTQARGAPFIYARDEHEESVYGLR